VLATPITNIVIQHGLAPDAIAEVTEDNTAEWTGHKAGRERAE
jgi:hypothetical protein